MHVGVNACMLVLSNTFIHTYIHIYCVQKHTRTYTTYMCECNQHEQAVLTSVPTHITPFKDKKNCLQMFSKKLNVSHSKSTLKVLDESVMRWK